MTTNPDISVSAAGEVAYFYLPSATTTAIGNVGDQLTYTASGVTRIDIPMTKSIQIKSILPHVAFATVSADVVGDRVISEGINAANKHNIAFLSYLQTAANWPSSTRTESTDTTTLTKDNVYAKIVAVKKEFAQIAANKANGIKADFIIVSPSVEALLLTCDQFVKLYQTGAEEAVKEGVIGRVAGLDVVVAQDFDETNDEFIIGNHLGLAAPTNVNTLVVQDATAAGYPAGTIIAGEIGYGFYLNKDLVMIKKHA